jgi:hypothetical protein
MAAPGEGPHELVVFRLCVCSGGEHRNEADEYCSFHGKKIEEQLQSFMLLLFDSEVDFCPDSRASGRKLHITKAILRFC